MRAYSCLQNRLQPFTFMLYTVELLRLTRKGTLVATNRMDGSKQGNLTEVLYLPLSSCHRSALSASPSSP